MRGWAPCTFQQAMYQAFTDGLVPNPAPRLVYGFFLRCGAEYADDVYKETLSEWHYPVHSSLEKGKNPDIAGAVYKVSAPERVIVVR